MRKVLVLGANGKVGRIVTQKLKDSSRFAPTATFRKEEQKDYFREMGVDYQVLSLEDTVEKLEAAIKGMDAVVFTAGSGGDTGDDMTLAVDLDGAVKAMEAADKAGVKRFVMVSGMSADDRSKWKASGINGYYIAKHYADRILKSSGLDYTILRPGLLLDEKGSETITTDNPGSQKGVPREDVANVILEVLDNNNAIGHTIEFNQGETPIKEAIENL